MSHCFTTIMKIALTFALSIYQIISFAQTDSILFLGNSYTYTQDVPGLLNSVANSKGKTLFIDQYTPGGKQLSQHYSDATSLQKINSHQWDYVVLQEQSQMPLINGNTVANYAQKIVLEQIKPNNSCTEVITYMTWAREAGNSWLTQINYTHEQMATYYENFYEDLWKYVPGRVSPVGKAFHEATRQGIDVYSSDGSHQNQTGSYIAALVFYATIYKESPIGVTYSPLNVTLTEKCQQIAHDVVMTDLYEHNILKVRFTMSATTIQKNATVDFTEAVYMYPFPDQFDWTFNNAVTTTSNAENPSSIEYAEVGNHSVTLEISDQCGYSESRTLTDTIQVEAPTAIESVNSNEFAFYPTVLTSGNQFSLLNQARSSFEGIEVFDVSGQAIQSNYNAGQLKIGSSIKNGAYFIQLTIEDQIKVQKVFVNR